MEKINRNDTNLTFTRGHFDFRCKTGVTQGHLEISLSEQFPDCIQVNSGHDKVACKGVAHIVPSETTLQKISFTSYQKKSGLSSFGESPVHTFLINRITLSVYLF